MNTAQSFIVVGVFENQSESVVVGAAGFAQRFGAQLVCAWVDTSRYAIGEATDGSAISLPTNPDVADLDDRGFPQSLTAQLRTALKGYAVPWSTRQLAGDPARALAHLAREIDSLMIVVGTREANIRGSLQEFFNGSVAVHLAHRQHRPVVVIPLNPLPISDALPWEES